MRLAFKKCLRYNPCENPDLEALVDVLLKASKMLLVCQQEDINCEHRGPAKQLVRMPDQQV